MPHSDLLDAAVRQRLDEAAAISSEPQPIRLIRAFLLVDRIPASVQAITRSLARIGARRVGPGYVGKQG